MRIIGILMLFMLAGCTGDRLKSSATEQVQAVLATI
jgi:hypothetical protein